MVNFKARLLFVSYERVANFLLHLRPHCQPLGRQAAFHLRTLHSSMFNFLVLGNETKVLANYPRYLSVTW